MKLNPSIRLSVYAGLTSLFLTLLCQAFQAFIVLPFSDLLKRTETIAVVSIGSLLVIEPFLHKLLSLIQSSHPEDRRVKELQSVGVRAFAGAVIVFVSI